MIDNPDRAGRRLRGDGRYGRSGGWEARVNLARCDVSPSGPVKEGGNVIVRQFAGAYQVRKIG